jgi:hypothetical protein
MGRGTSLNRVCNELGLPGGHDKTRTLAKARQVIQKFFLEHQRRPTLTDLPKWNDWLSYNEGLSIAKLSDEMGLPGGLVLGRTMQDARDEILRFFEDHGKRPRGKDLIPVRSWLASQGTTMRKMCDELGLPASLRLDRSLKAAKREIRVFYEEHGRRPRVCDMGAWNSWLQAHHKLSVPRLCDQMDIPGGKRRNRTMDGARREVQSYFKEHGHRPRTCDLHGLSRWLCKKQRTSLADFCDELGLPERKRGS